MAQSDIALWLLEGIFSTGLKDCSKYTLCTDDSAEQDDYNADDNEDGDNDDRDDDDDNDGCDDGHAV